MKNFKPTIEHITLYYNLSLKGKMAIRQLSKMTGKFEDTLNYFLNDSSKDGKNPVDLAQCTMLAELAHYMMNDDLSLNIPAPEFKISELCMN